jgi:hypothetical protein
LFARNPAVTGLRAAGTPEARHKPIELLLHLLVVDHQARYEHYSDTRGQAHVRLSAFNRLDIRQTSFKPGLSADFTTRYSVCLLA